MYLKFTAHKPAQSGTSSRAIFDYLDKENQARRDRDIQEWRNGDISEERREELLRNFYNYDNLFNQDFDLNNLDDKKNHISVESAFRMIDENKGTQKNKDANFYMLNISPSTKELEHLEKQAEEILAERGLKKEEVVKNGNTDLWDYYEEQKQQVLNAQLKSYAQDVMNEYAHQMGREVYVNQDKLPSDKERREMLPEIERRYNEYLYEKGLIQEELKNEKTIKTEAPITRDFSKNDEFKVIGEVTDTENKSSMLKIKPEGYSEEVKLWVNNRDFSQSEKGEILFKDKEQAQRLIDKAIERDKVQKEQISIKYDKVTVEDIKVKEGREPDKMYTFERREEGLKEPIKFTFKESELQKQGEELTAPKFKLEYREQIARERGINAEYGEVKNKIREQVWQEHGFDTAKRKLEGKDLMWFGKIETERSYSYKDKQVLENRETMKQIKELKAQLKPDTNKIKELENQLHRDKHSGEIIKEGLKKQGNQTHIHIVVSRHDKTSVNPKDKVSMSPMANQKDSQIQNGAKVGFNRDNFFQKTEEIFDKKFSYDRPLEQTYQYHKVVSNTDRVIDSAKGRAQTEIKHFIENYTGLNKLKRELNPTNEFKKEFRKVPLPTYLPKSKLDAVRVVVKAVKRFVQPSPAQEMGY